MSIYMIIGFYSIIYSWRRLVRPGISAHIRNLFLKKHALYVVANIILNMLQLLLNYYDLFNVKLIGNLDHNRDTIKIISMFFASITGIVMSAIRTYDPYFWYLIKKNFWQVFGFVVKEPKYGNDAQVLSTFLSSSLNIEMVYIILTGITKFSNNTFIRQRSSVIEEEEEYVSPFERIRIMQLNKIRISNSDKWNVALDK